MSSDVPEFSNDICSTQNCNKSLTSRGFCTACYYRNLRYGTFKPNTQTKKWKHRLSDINSDKKIANCSNCGIVKITKRSKNSWRCSVDANERSRIYKQAYRQNKKEDLLDYCQICGKKEKLCWDHNHSTGKHRGTLCSNCNVGIGLFEDNIEYLIKAIIYIDEDIIKNEN